MNTTTNDAAALAARDAVLLEIQKRIAVEKGYTALSSVGGMLYGCAHPDEGMTLVPRWPWDWCAASELVEDMAADPALYGWTLNHDPRPAPNTDSVPYEFLFYGPAINHDYRGVGDAAAEAVARCWCAWKGIVLSDLPTARAEGGSR